jgi:SAM-dependent methyltransferase
VDYHGAFSFKFQRSVAAWWIGLYNESLQLSRELLNEKMPEAFNTAVRNNIKTLTEILHKSSIYGKQIDYPYYLQKEHLKYDASMHHRLKVKFPESSGILENFSQAYQDLLVLGMLKGKKFGRFLEVGCGVPIINNNTYLLEKYFGWSGISIDLNKDVLDLFHKHRESTAINADATKIQYEKILQEGDYDYLQIDCDPAIISYKALLRIPFESHRFAVITFEHDYHIDVNREVRDLSRSYLASLGYLMIVNDVALSEFTPFEDWYIHPDLVDKRQYEKIMWIDDQAKRADRIILI